MDNRLSKKTYNDPKNIVSHVLCTHLTSILGFNHLLTATNLTPEQINYAKNIEKSAKQLLLATNLIIKEIM